MYVEDDEWMILDLVLNWVSGYLYSDLDRGVY